MPTGVPAAHAHRLRKTVGAYIALTKPRILWMLLFTALCTMILAAHGWPGTRLTAATLIGLAMSTGGGAAFNMWYDRDIDAVMSRTRHRPLPAGMVPPTGALVWSLCLVTGSVILLWAFVHPLAAVLSAAGFVYYALVYTVWLKRRTPQNIVIGGGAGAFPVLVGWAAVTGHLDLGAWGLFAIVFFWTPPHFWALALFKNQDYVRAGVPMMPVVRGERAARVQSLVHAALLLAVTVALPWLAPVGPLYVAVSSVVGAVFLYSVFRMYREADGRYEWARRTFVCSLGYLPAVFLAVATTGL
ncbi:MAG: heme o synthase [Alicyclobacillus sp.]|nr:heme o synthase [Alicyclobacillus sp.]